MKYQAMFDIHPGSDFWNHNYYETREGARLHYVRAGRGIPVVLLHGWPGFWYDWRHVIPVIAKEVEVIAPDLLGFGYSAKPNSPTSELYEPDAQAARILELLDELEFDRFVAVGYDIGARVAQSLARMVPGRVRSLILGNPAYPGIGDRRFSYPAQKEFWYQHFHNISGIENLVGYNRDTVRLYLAYFYQHWSGRKDKVREQEFEGIVDVYSQPDAFGASIGWYRSGAGTGLASKLNQDGLASPMLPIVQPTYILWGELDPIFPKEWSDHLTAFFPQVNIKYLPAVGHFIPFEAPEEMIETIKTVI